MTAPTVYDNSIMAVDDYHADNPTPWFTTSCDILWGTNTTSSSQVEYGKTISYGSSTTLDETLTRNHSVALTGLDESSTYHYRVKSKNALAEETVSSDHTFVTEQAIGIGTYDFKIRAFGPKNAYQGSTIYWNIEIRKLVGDFSNMNTSFEVRSGLPTGASAVFLASYLHTGIRWTDTHGRPYCWGGPKLDDGSNTIDDFPLAIIVGAASPIGDYTLTVRLTTWDRDTLVDEHYEEVSVPITVQTAASVYAAPSLGVQPVLPQLALWESQMDLGRDPGKGPSYPDLLNGFFSVEGLDYFGLPGAEGGAWYYDGMRVAYNIREYIGVGGSHYDYWNTAISNVYDHYFSWAMNSQLGNGWRHFTDGARLVYHKDGGPSTYKDMVYAFYNMNGRTDVAGYAIGHGYITSACVGSVVQTCYGRECAYAVNAAVNSSLLGYSVDVDRLHAYVDCLLGIIDQWFSAKTSPYFQPFMMGLVAEALMSYHDNYDSTDYRILPRLKIAADYLWDNAWRSDVESFIYESKNWIDFDYPCILNLLIVEMYGWIYRETGDTTYRDRGDEIWTYGVISGAPGWNGKQFCQSYKASFNYYKIRTQQVEQSGTKWVMGFKLS